MRLIDADEVLARIENPYQKAEIARWLRDAPTIERKTGKWIHNPDPMAGEGYWNCSECGLNVYTCTDYCPNCGARMEG